MDLPVRHTDGRGRIPSMDELCALALAGAPQMFDEPEQRTALRFIVG